MTDTTTEKWRFKIDNRLDKIEIRISDLEKNAAVEEVHRTNVESRLGKIETNLTWLVRLMVGAIISAGLAFLLNGSV